MALEHSTSICLSQQHSSCLSMAKTLNSSPMHKEIFKSRTSLNKGQTLTCMTSIRSYERSKTYQDVVAIISCKCFMPFSNCIVTRILNCCTWLKPSINFSPYQCSKWSFNEMQWSKALLFIASSLPHHQWTTPSGTKILPSLVLGSQKALNDQPE